MNPEHLVPTRELCQQLIDAGIVLDTYFVWYNDGRTWKLSTKSSIQFISSPVLDVIPAPTAEELWNYLDAIYSEDSWDYYTQLTVEKYDNETIASYPDLDNVGGYMGISETIASALAELAIKVEKYEQKTNTNRT